MKGYQEVERKVIKIVENAKIPKEIKDKINEYGKKYYDTCDSYISRINMLRNFKADGNLKQESEQDYKGDILAIEGILCAAYTIKKDAFLNEVRNSTKYLTDTNEKEKEEKRYNEDFIRTVKNEIISEFLGSRRYILQKTQIQGFEMNNMEKRLQIESARKIFQEDVDRIVQEIEKDFPEVKRVLTEQDREIYEEILKVIEEEKVKTESDDTKSFSEKRKIFVDENRKNVNVDEKLAQEELKENDENKSLDEFLID